MKEILCLCMGVTCVDVEAAVAGGALSFDQVRMVTRCAASCGMCADKICAEVEKLLWKTGDDCKERGARTECTKR